METFSQFRCVVLSSIALLLGAQASAMDFVPGDFYTATGNFSNVISHYDHNGTFVDNYSVDSSLYGDVRGLAFSPSGLLYAVVTPQGGGSSFSTIAINSSGNVVQTFTAPDFIIGDGGYGKINFSSDGHFYVAANNHVDAFLPGNSTSTQIYSGSQIIDVKPLPNGNLLVLSSYNLREISSSGVLVRDIMSNPALYDAQGVEYDPSTNKIYVTTIGDSSNPFPIMRVNGTTGQIEAMQSFHYGMDIFRTSDGRYLVGSRTQTPRFYDANLNLVGTLGNSQQLFVTQMPSSVPEPLSMVVVGLGALGLIKRRKRG